jgi:Zn-dependent oligopeptidase
MADSPSQIFELIEGISQKATKKSKQELDVLKKYFNLENISIFDLAYYTRKYKQDNYNVDDKKIKKYFELEYTVNYLHNFVKDFYGLELRQVKLDSYNDNIRIYEVYKDKTLISYYFMDLFYTKNKRA